VRWGILVNLAAILVVSGLLLFLVFSASLERAGVDARTHQAGVLVDLIARQLTTATTEHEMWERVRLLCKRRAGVRFLLYDSQGRVLGGCGAGEEPGGPILSTPGRRIQILGGRWPIGVFKEASVIIDDTREFPHGVRSIRSFLKIPPAVFDPSRRLFAAYLVITQAALLFLGYLLFHRTVIGPIREVAGIAAKAVGIAEAPQLPDTLRLNTDIQRIASSLRGMVLKILEDRNKMESMIEQLQQINRDLEAAQQGLIRSEKLAGVGRLAAGVAHEIGNPLQIVLGYVELLEKEQDPETQSDILTRMEQELKRIDTILERLLDFARPMPENIVPSDINELVKECGSLMEGRKGYRRIEFEYFLDSDLPIIETEPEKLRQILVNLIFNAADAIPESGGKIILSTRSNSKDLEIEVKDTGSGIEQENLEKIFDPFFTTKEPGKGTGLGLAVCAGLVESLRGAINVESTEGQGTTVLVSLPIAPVDQRNV
jgi:two-component system NtrC family sensor kinase